MRNSPGRAAPGRPDYPNRALCRRSLARSRELSNPPSHDRRVQAAQSRPFVVLGKSLLPGLSPANAGLVRAFYEDCGPFSPGELWALETVGMDLFVDRGRWVGPDEAWLRPTPM